MNARITFPSIAKEVDSQIMQIALGTFAGNLPTSMAKYLLYSNQTFDFLDDGGRDRMSEPLQTRNQLSFPIKDFCQKLLTLFSKALESCGFLRFLKINFLSEYYII